MLCAHIRADVLIPVVQPSMHSLLELVVLVLHRRRRWLGLARHVVCDELCSKRNGGSRSPVTKTHVGVDMCGIIERNFIGSACKRL